MCQWNIKLRSRLEAFPLDNAERLDDKIVARLVPKFHLAAHKEGCRVNFSLNYEPGVGRSDMEGPERTWFGLQGGGSTKDQGPGYWSDAMDDKFGHWNWFKLVRLGTNFESPPFSSDELAVQVHSSRRSILMPSHNQQSTRTNSTPFAPTSRKTFSTRGPQRSSRGRLIEVSPTRTSPLHLVCLITDTCISF